MQILQLLIYYRIILDILEDIAFKFIILLLIF